MKPIVSICCMTYNHVNFIKDCIEGFIEQKTDFDYEILIHDDASADNTTAIVREYEKKYPELIKVIYQTENQFLKQNVLHNLLIPMAKGKYIALCEGDDYWTDSNKLQKQIDFLEANEEYSYCGHKSKSKSNSDINKISINLQEFGFKELIRKNLLNTSTLMFRKDSIIVSPTIMKNIDAGDWFLQLFAIKNSKAYVLPDYMSVYRLHEKGIWSNLNKREQCLNGVKTLEALKQLFNDKESIVLINEAIESRKKDFGIIERSRIEKILLKINRIRVFNWINFRLK